MDNGPSLIIPLMIAIGSLLAMVIYVLCVAVRNMAKQLTDMNHCLLLAWQAAQGDTVASRGLVAKAMNQPPQRAGKKLDGVAPKKPETPKTVITMGAR